MEQRHRRPGAGALLLAGLLAAQLPGALTAAEATATAAASPAAAGDPTAAALRQRALDSDLAYELVSSLTTEVGPRLAGSAGDRRAVAWGVATLERLGFDRVVAEPVTVPHWDRGEAEAAILAPYPQRLHVTALGGSVGTAEEGIEAEVIELHSVVELEQATEEQVGGKIVFLSQAMERHRDGSGYREAVPNRGRGPSLAAALGAVAVVIRSVATGSHRFPHTGSLRYAEGAPRIPAAALAVPDAELLQRQIAGGQPVRLRLRLTARHLPEAQSANVIGDLRGSSRPDEIVLLACHLDSWDLGTGALDDGAGCGIVIAAAKLIAEQPKRPARTLRVVLYANEEFGLSGGRAYAERHAEELSRHVLAAEADLGAGRVFQLAGFAAPAGMKLLQEALVDLAPLGVEWIDQPAHGGADLGPLDAARVPMADLRHDATTYFDYHHTADDTLDKVVPEDLRQCVAAFAVLAWHAADDDRPLGPAPVRPED